MIIRHNGTVIRQLHKVNIQDSMMSLQDSVNNIYDEGKIIKEIWIDGVDVTGSLEEFINNHYESLKTVDIVSATPDEMVNEIYIDTLSYLEKVAQACDSISDRFYGDVDANTWGLLEQLMEGLAYTIQSLRLIAEHYSRSANSGIMPPIVQELVNYISQIESCVKMLHQAVNDEDHVGVADILKYELADIVAKVRQTMELKVS